jgi:Flp pilus assembly protein TadG
MKGSIPAIDAIKALWCRLAGDRNGATAVEFAIAVPLFSTLIIGIAQGGLLLFDEIELAYAANVGSRTFATARQPLTAGGTATPFTSTINAIANSGGLTLTKSNVTLSVGGSSCASDSACLTSLNNAYNSDAYYSTTNATSVTVTYLCPELLPLSWMPLTGVCATGSLSVTMSQQLQ